MQYLSYWSLMEPPFRHDAAVRFHRGERQAAALFDVGRFIESKNRLGYLVARSGCGATSLVRYIAATRGWGDQAVEVIATSGKGSLEETVRRLAVAFGVHRAASVEQCIDWIRQSNSAEIQAFWVIDDCQRHALELAEHLTNENVLSALVCVPALAASAESATLINLSPMSIKQTHAYVRWSLEAVGGSGETWSDSAIEMLHHLGDGRIARMAAIAESTMMKAAAMGTAKIFSHDVADSGPFRAAA